MENQGISESTKPCVCGHIIIIHTHIYVYIYIHIYIISEADFILKIWLQILPPHPIRSSYNVTLTFVPLNVGIYVPGWNFVTDLTNRVQ